VRKKSKNRKMKDKTRKQGFQKELKESATETSSKDSSDA
jgi:hypothetical protein